jgi:hypothetical protein
MPTSILWASQHSPLRSQREELRRLFGDDVCIVTSPTAMRDVGDLLDRLHQLDPPRELLLVAPLSVCREVIKRGVKPLWAEMQRVTPAPAFIDPNTMTQHDTRVSRFIGFRRLTGVTLEFEDLEPVATRGENGNGRQ